MNILTRVHHKLYQYSLHAKTVISLLISFFYKKEQLWLLSERGNEARDNGYAFYKYLKNNKRNINIKFVIGRNSKDLERITGEDRVYYRTWSHYIYMWRATHHISTHICGCTPDHAEFYHFDKKYNLFRNKVKVFLQHGITYNDLPYVYGKNTNLDIFACGAKTEYEYIKAKFGHKDNVVRYTGLCRYDNLIDFKKKKQILVMPTWRSYINKQDFTNSDYFTQFKQLLTNNRLHKLLNDYNYSLVFYPHHEVQGMIELFKQLEVSERITIASFEYDVQTLLKESALLITDYSSVYFDFAYMHKPVLFYQFDYDKFFSKHYTRGYIHEENIGCVTRNMDDLIIRIEENLKNGCIQKNKERQFIDNFFVYHDKNNSKRLFNAIKQITAAKNN